jgi:hypothetical protein
VAFSKALDDERFETMKADIDNVIEEDADNQKGTLNIRIHKCFAIKVVLPSWKSVSVIILI